MTTDPITAAQDVANFICGAGYAAIALFLLIETFHYLTRK